MNIKYHGCIYPVTEIDIESIDYDDGSWESITVYYSGENKFYSWEVELI